MQSRLRVKERKVEKMVSPHAKYVARTTTVSAGPKASKAKVRPSKGKEKAMENLRAKEKEKETRVEAPHLRSVRSVARTTILPRTVSSATRDQFSKQAMLLRSQMGCRPHLAKPQFTSKAAADSTSQPNHVAAIGERERSTSAETEVARATMGISSANQYGQARCLLDTGADEHICPASFAEWIKPVAHSSGPRLRDAQGKVMQHGNKIPNGDSVCQDNRGQ